MSNYKILNPRKKLKTCNPSSSSEDFIIDIFIHIIILSIVLSIFFFTVVSPLEKENLQGEMDAQVTDGLKHSFDSLDEKNKDAAKQVITENEELLKKIKEMYSEPSKEDELYNQNLTNLNITIIINLGLILLTIWITLKLSCNKCVLLGKIMLENVLLFSMIGIIEYLFFVNIAMDYIPVKPSYVKTIIVKKLNDL
jgi:hypothetical protein